jgi:hypothetical protein
MRPPEINGLELVRRRSDRDRLLKGLDFFHGQVSRRGRPSGSGAFDSAEEFRRVVTAAIRALRQQGRRVTQETVLEFMTPSLPRNRRAGDGEMDARQMRSWCEQFGVDWHELKRTS